MVAAPLKLMGTDAAPARKLFFNKMKLPINRIKMDQDFNLGPFLFYIHFVWNVPSLSTRLYVCAPK